MNHSTYIPAADTDDDVNDDFGDQLYGNAGADEIHGGDDVVDGDNVGDLIHGNAGNDTIYGDAGEDVLLGLGGDGTIWVMGESTGIPYYNVFSSDCASNLDNRVKIGWKMNLADNRLDITVQTFGAGAVKEKFGPFTIPQPLLDEGWSRCIYQVPPETGKYYFDGVKCASTSPPIFDPVPDSNQRRR